LDFSLYSQFSKFGVSQALENKSYTATQHAPKTAIQSLN
jgi:hypothetical protein